LLGGGWNLCAIAAVVNLGETRQQHEKEAKQPPEIELGKDVRSKPITENPDHGRKEAQTKDPIEPGSQRLRLNAIRSLPSIRGVLGTLRVARSNEDNARRRSPSGRCHDWPFSVVHERPNA